MKRIELLDGGLLQPVRERLRAWINARLDAPR
jgi:hypothetical protein